MKLMKLIMIAILIVLTINAISASAFEPQKGIAPFFDGLYLEYSATFMNPMVGKKKQLKPLYKVTVFDSNHYIVNYINSIKSLVDLRGIIIDFALNVDELEVKSEGFDKFSDIWIAPDAMRVGATIDGYKIVKRTKWKKWDVFVLSAERLGEQYYEINTGFKVGSYADTDLIYIDSVLVKTNANIPKFGE